MEHSDLDRLKEIARSDEEDPDVTTMETQIRTTKFAMFPDPKEPEDEEEAREQT
jgi:hypothetical protein